MEIKKSFNKNIVLTLAVILLLSVCFVTASLAVNDVAVRSCYNTLEDAVEKFVADVKSHVANDTEQLELAAGFLSEHDEFNYDALLSHLRTFEKSGMMEEVAVLLPDGQMVFSGDSYTELKDKLDFEEEAAKTFPYTSNVLLKDEDATQKYIYHAVMIRKGGELKGILYGVVNLNNLSRTYEVTAFRGQSEQYVLDGETGDFLIDTWHDSLGNVFSEEMSDRKVKGERTFEDMREDLKQGRAGNLIFFSQTAEKYFYSYYQPVGINRWMAQITVTEDVAFANAFRIRHILYILTAVYVVIFLAYFYWVLRNSRREEARRELQLQRTLYIMDVQQTLFDAHKNPELMKTALQKAAKILTAGSTFLISVEKTSVTKLYIWPVRNQEWEALLSEEGLREALPNVYAMLERGESFLYYEQDKTNVLRERCFQTLDKYKISNLMLAAILDSDGRLVGILGAINMKDRWRDVTWLECIAHNFLMALDNVDAYRKIQEMGTLDALTGLKNRNSYQQTLREFAEKNEKALCCIYADANGLHDLNNSLGHAAGDAMLRYIGDSIRRNFGEAYTFRIGGDEFVVFVPGGNREEVNERLRRLDFQVTEKEYHVSFGQAWQTEDMTVDELIAEAETRMYEAKRRYYEEQKDVSKARQMNQKLEKILTEKRDADEFLSIISSYFMGVYVVNLHTDKMRSIYQPAYFENMLVQSNYRFREALHLYIDSCVQETDRKDFYRLLDYDHVKQELEKGSIVEYHFQKLDGKKLMLRIYRVQDLNTEWWKETFWLFEEINE